MMKHYKTTPSLKQQQNNRSHDLQEVRPNLNNISTSSSDSSLILEDRNDDVLQDYPHDQVARQVVGQVHLQLRREELQQHQHVPGGFGQAQVSAHQHQAQRLHTDSC